MKTGTDATEPPPNMTLNEFRQKLPGLRIWKQEGKRAPHKPLLLLLAIGKAVRGEERLVPFSEIEDSLTGLLRHFGPPSKVFHPVAPFGRLVTDGLWEIPNAGSLRRTKSGDLSPLELRTHGITGGLPHRLYRLLAADHPGARAAAQQILDEHFPVSMHQHILEAVGLDGIAKEDSKASKRASRDPRFRELVLIAYERRCAVCGFDLRVGDDLLGLEAAHIRWHSHGGPDHVTNGLALCTFHHGAFDRGALGLDDNAGGAGYRVVVSPSVNGQSAARDWLWDYHEGPLRRPQKGAAEPAAAHVSWHAKQVFRAAPQGL